MNQGFDHVEKREITDNHTDKTVEGHFKALIIEDGVTTTHFEKHNVIVDGARKIMARAIGDCIEPYCINQFRAGGDNTIEMVEALNPPSPVPTDTNIIYTANLFVRNKGDNIAGIPAFVVSYPNTPSETSVLFSIKIGKSEGNVMDPIATVYTAAGLFMSDGDLLFSSQTFPVMTKTPSREFWFEWEIRF